MNAQSRKLLAGALLVLLLAYGVIVLGAYVRLSHAGLGCPDWPGCYGELFVTDELWLNAARYGESARPYDQSKAFKEMLHRYVAGALGLAILVLACCFWRAQRRYRAIALALPCLVAFQGLLGMWTVTELLRPLIVSAHLLGGLCILAMLYWLCLEQLPASLNRAQPVGRTTARLALAGMVALGMQLFLGGWTSANYAALICPEFPTCRDGLWWPDADFREGFVLWHEGRQDYEGGILDASARTAIHLSHRLGAVITATLLLCAAVSALRQPSAPLRSGGVFLLCALCAQLASGIANVLLRLPMPVAVAHNALAALLLLSLLTVYRFAVPRRATRP